MTDMGEDVLGTGPTHSRDRALAFTGEAPRILLAALRTCAARAADTP